MAILNNDEFMTRMLLEQGADPNEMDCYQNTALHLALSDDNISDKVVNTILRFNDKINFSSFENNKVFMLAVKRKSVPVVQLFTSM